MSSENKPKGADNECIQVVVRCRPLNKKENEEKRASIIDIDIEARQVSIKNPDNLNETPKYFTYDAAYDENTQQRIFYDESCFNVIEGTLEGFNSTIFAYGQTGCGKSFTMQGPSTTIDNLKGVIPNSFSHIFQFVKASKDIVFLIRCSYLELYNEEIKDLLSNAKQQGEKCELKEDPQKGVYVKGLTTVVVESADDLNKMLDRGLLARTTAATNMNAESSRSHSIFTIIVEMNTKDSMTGKDMLRVGKLNLVDLAGSERQKKTGAKDATLKEGIKINLSLSALGNVISALSEGSRHIPYRDSKLTRLLQDSLGGNTKTMMIAAISPADYNYEETMSTLRYANRAKNIKNKPKINEDPKDTMIREFKEEIERLRNLLAAQAAGGLGNAGAGQALQAMAAMMGQMQQVASSDTQADSGHQHVGSPGVGAHKTAAAAGKSPKKDKENHSALHSNAADDDNVSYSPDKDHFSHTYSSAGMGGALESLGDDGSGATHSARERTMEDVESRLHQLEGMLVSNHDGEMGHSLKAVSALNTVGSEIMSQPWAPTEEEIAEEEEAARAYQARRNQALKKKEAQQEREMARILEERRAMEEELEELRLSTRATSSAAGNVTQGLQGTVSGPHSNAASNGNSNANSGYNNLNAVVAEAQATMAKKMSRMKKKYDKKLAAAKEALEDLQADFSYERKQFADAAAEQEKDIRLYELICQAVLSDKDLKKIIEKCRYDDEKDEWIIPFTKKKTISDSQWQQAEASSGGGGANRSLFPEIGAAPTNMTKGPTSSSSNGNGSGGNLQALGSTLRDPSRMNGKQGTGTSRDNNDERPSPVPLLTLPGNLMTTASLVSPAGPHHTNNSAGASKVDKGGFLPQISSRSDANTGRNAAPDPFEYNNNSSSAFAQLQILPSQGLEKKKKPKNKVPKSQGNPPSGLGAGVGYAPSSARSQGEDYVDITDNDLSGSSNMYLNGPSSSGGSGGGGVALNKENGTEFAGPVEDWGFVYDPKQLAQGPGQGNDPELDYYEDEDFESPEDIISSSQYKSHDGPYPPAYGNGSGPSGAPKRKGAKKKKKVQEEGSVLTSSSNNSKGSSSFALPPI